MAAFVHALGRPELLAAIEASIKHLAVGSQLLDDMGDWEDDLRDHHLTYYLARLAPPHVWQASPWPETAALQAQIDANWLDLEGMHMAQAWLDRALDAVRDLPCNAWTAYVNGYRTLAGEHLKRYQARHLLRTIEPLLGGGGSR
jgi:hypothetical protein